MEQGRPKVQRCSEQPRHESLVGNISPLIVSASIPAISFGDDTITTNSSDQGVSDCLGEDRTWDLPTITPTIGWQAPVCPSRFESAYLWCCGPVLGCDSLSCREEKRMKFHVTVTPRRPQVPPVAVIDQSIAWIKAKLSDKTADCCYGFIGGGGIAIFNADTSDAMLKLLISYPAYP